MNELITRGRIFIAQPPLYRIKKGKAEKYIKDEKDFTREIMRRATENVVVESGAAGGEVRRIEGGELRSFLMNLDEYEQMAQKVERRLRDGRGGGSAVRRGAAGGPQGGLPGPGEHGRGGEAAGSGAGVNAELKADEEHSAWQATFHDSTNAERRISLELAAMPEYRKLRALARQVARVNTPPFVVVRSGGRENQGNWRDLLAFVKNEGKRDASVQRYKGLGEMNAEQLAETTMNPERRTLLQVRLDDAVESEEIFSTLMGEDVESRRKFIEENALDVKNLGRVANGARACSGGDRNRL